jgi:hypothetical protein
MARVPTAARRSRVDDEDEQGEKKESARKRITLASHILSTTQVPQLGRPPKDDEEKRQVYLALVHMKSARLTNKECAEKLGLSERTIANYLRDPYYVEVEGELQQTAKARGYDTIAMISDDALAELYSIMKTDKSGFVRFKSAEAILNYAGYGMPREEAKRDSREEVNRFLAMVNERQGSVQVNVQVNTPGALPASSTRETIHVVESEEAPIPEELAQYYQLVGPGGSMPGTERKRESPTSGM